MSNSYKINLWSAKEGYNPDLSTPALWDGFKYYTDCVAFHMSISHGNQQPYWQGVPPRDSELNIINKYIETTNRNERFIDVGGHIGTMSIPLSKIYGRGVAFEPQRDNYDFLIRNLEANDINNVVAFNVGLSDCDSSVAVVRHDDHNSGCYQCKDDPDGEMNCVPLDSRFSYASFIKIDVQGKELDVLKGAINLIRKCKPFMMIEVSDEETDFTCTKDSVVEFLQKEGYHIYHDNGADIFMCVEEGEVYVR